MSCHVMAWHISCHIMHMLPYVILCYHQNQAVKYIVRKCKYQFTLLLFALLRKLKVVILYIKPFDYIYIEACCHFPVFSNVYKFQLKTDFYNITNVIFLSLTKSILFLQYLTCLPQCGIISDVEIKMCISHRPSFCTQICLRSLSQAIAHVSFCVCVCVFVCVLSV